MSIITYVLFLVYKVYIWLLVLQLKSWTGMQIFLLSLSNQFTISAMFPDFFTVNRFQQIFFCHKYVIQTHS